MGCSTGNLVIDDDESLHAVFKLAADNNLIVAVHAEDEHLMRENAKQYNFPQPYQTHSLIRNEEVAARAVEKAIALSHLYMTKLYILHVSTLEELALIKQAKAKKIPVFAETTPHHLFLNTGYYKTLQGKAVMNPPLRSKEHQQALFKAIHEGVIDTIGSDHAPHTLEEKNQPYGCCPSGVPGIETTLPLLLNAYHQQLLSLPEIIALTSANAKKIFQLPDNTDHVLVDLAKIANVDESILKTKCGWSPFMDMTLKGWPAYTILNNKIFDLKNI